VIKSRIMRRAEHVARMGGREDIYGMDVQIVGWDVDWIDPS
jgi:hypothetical protein